MKVKPSRLFRQSGVIPWRPADRGLEILLITSRRTGAWIIPKGVIEPDLSPLESACKEAWEEAGVVGRPAPDPLGSFRHEKWGGVCEVAVYRLRVDSVAEEWPEARVRRREWMRLRPAAAAVQNPELRALILRLPAAIAGTRRAD